MNASKALIFTGALAIGAAAGYWAGRSGNPEPTSTVAATPAPAPGGILFGPAATVAAASAAQARPGATLESLLKSAGKPDATALSEWAKTLSPRECAAALAQLKDLPPGLQRNAILEAVVGAWAARDPQGFVENAGSIPIPRVREEGITAALKAWAVQNPQEALKWFKDNPGSASGSVLQARYAALINGMATNDPKAAFDLVNSLGDTSLRDRQMKSAAMRGLSDALAEQGRFTDAMGLYATLPAGAARTEAYDRMMQRWGESAPQDAAAWLASAEDPAMRAQLGPRLVESWAASDPAGAAAWAAQTDAQIAAEAAAGGAPNDTSGQLLAGAIRAWATYDLDAPAEYLNTLEASPTKDRAVSIFALRAAQEDPASAMEWVGTISNEQSRSGLAMGVAFQWLQQDPAGFQEYAATSTTLDDQQKQMLQSIPPNALENLSRLNSIMGGQEATQRLMENMIINGPPGGGRGIFGGGRRGGGGGGNN